MTSGTLFRVPLYESLIVFLLNPYACARPKKLAVRGHGFKESAHRVAPACLGKPWVGFPSQAPA